MPLRIDTVDDESIADEASEPEGLLKLAMTRSQNLITRFDVTRPGAALVRVEDTRTGEPHSGSGGPTAGAYAVTARHPRLRELNLNLNVREVPWPKASRLGAHKGASSCAKEVDWQKGVGFRLTLAQGGRTIVLNDDEPSRPRAFAHSATASQRCTPSTGRTARSRSR